MPVAQGFRGFFKAADGRIAVVAIDRNEMREVEGLANDGPFEQGALQENGDAAWDCPNHRRGIGRAGMVRREDDRAGRNAINSPYFDADTDGSHEEHDAIDARPIERIYMPGEQRVDEEKWTDE